MNDMLKNLLQILHIGTILLVSAIKIQLITVMRGMWWHFGARLDKMDAGVRITLIKQKKARSFS